MRSGPQYREMMFDPRTTTLTPGVRLSTARHAALPEFSVGRESLRRYPGRAQGGWLIGVRERMCGIILTGEHARDLAATFVPPVTSVTLAAVTVPAEPLVTTS